MKRIPYPQIIAWKKNKEDSSNPKCYYEEDEEEIESLIDKLFAKEWAKESVTLNRVQEN